MRLPTRALAYLIIVAAVLLLAAGANASASAAERERMPAPIDVIDDYLGVVNMNRCCDCHRTIC